MITPKTAKPSKADEADAYELATLRDGDACLFRAWDCLGAAQRDHRQNRRPGNTVVSNIQLLCVTHHQWKTEHPEEAIRDGWAVPSWPTVVPAEWPARRRMRGRYGVYVDVWVLYANDGTWRQISDEEARKRMEGTN